MNSPWIINEDSITLDDLNVRRAFILIRKRIEEALENMWMRFNTPDTRTEIITRLDPIFKELQVNHFLYNYKIICDATNNPPELIDNHGIVIDVMYDRHKDVINTLRIEMVAAQIRYENNDPQGQVFSELDPYGEENWKE